VGPLYDVKRRENYAIERPAKIADLQVMSLVAGKRNAKDNFKYALWKLHVSTCRPNFCTKLISIKNNKDQ
jgi:hypothetical protein